MHQETGCSHEVRIKNSLPQIVNLLDIFLFPFLAFSKQNTCGKLSELEPGWKRFLFLPPLFLFSSKVVFSICLQASLLRLFYHLDITCTFKPLQEMCVIPQHLISFTECSVYSKYTVHKNKKKSLSSLLSGSNL